MSPRVSFGKTWWGSRWVEAMERIDYNSNRLPRGRRYANNGSVRTIDIKDGRVFAKVQGSRPRPYNIEISLKRFNNSQIKRIKGLIEDNPAIVSDLSLGKLSEPLLPMLNEHKIPLLPERWDDISADCSCPDWANPCKHLAAVYYIIANEIDKDPFLLFNLKGIPRESLIETGGIAGNQGLEKRDQESEIFIPFQQACLPSKRDRQASQFPIPYPGPSSEMPELTFKPFDIEAILSILPDKPLFYNNGDFKKLLLQAYRGIMDSIGAIEINEGDAPSFKGIDIYLVKRLDEYTFFITPGECLPNLESIHNDINKSAYRASEQSRPRRDEARSEAYFQHTPQRRAKSNAGMRSYDALYKDASIKCPVISRGALVIKKMKGGFISADKMTALFSGIPLDINPDNNSPSSLCIAASVSIALAFIRAGSFVPQIDMHGDGNFSIRYVPLIHDEKGKTALDYLKSIMPVNICFRDKDCAVLSQSGVHEIISLIITSIVRRYGNLSGDANRDKLYETFFRGRTYSANRFEERQTAKALSDWLERLSIRKKDVSPVIMLQTFTRDRFAIAIDIENKKDPLTSPIPLSSLFDDRREVFSYPVEAVRRDVSRQLSIASEYMPQIRYVLNSRGAEKAIITLSELSDFLTVATSILDILGIRIAVPKELKKLASPRIAIRVESKGETVSYLSLDSMLNFSWEIAIGDKAISKEEFLKLVKSAKGIVRFKDQYILIKPEDMQGMLDRIKRPVPELSSMEILHAAMTGEAEGMLFNYDDAIKRMIEDLTRVEEIDIPQSLNAQLRPYQERGFRWLYSNTVKGFGSCIADDMGLGKTIQVITLILKLKEDDRLKNPILVVSPTTLVGNWQKECQRFAPELNVSIYHGTERSLVIKGVDLVITTYGIVRRDIEKFKDRQWGLVVIDEAQNIKNPETDQTKAVKSLKGGAYIAMSGTPVENRLTELWSIFDFINRGYLSYADKFRRQYAIPIERYRDRERIERLRQVTAPFMLRRLKTDKTIISDLPDKLIFDEYCYLTKEQTAMYQRVVDETMKTIERSEGIERKGLIFKLITSLKQICNHPVHYAKKGDAAKEQSGKAEKTVEILGKILSMKEKALIFTQYKEMGEILLKMMRDDLGEDALFFHGGITRQKRDRMVHEFQDDDSQRLMILSLKAGGTGLNLTSATNVVHYDLWWNPAVEAQATDRAYRIGQDKNVMVHRLITIGTFEERIDEMIKRKKELAELTVTTGEQWITELSDRELREIFSLAK